MKAVYALLAGLTAHAAAWDYNAQPYNSPIYANNECSDKQKNGFDWSELKDGQSNFQYNEFDFSKGWKCSNTFGKRQVFSARSYQNRVITNKCSKTQPASFGSDKKKYGFSISTIQLTSEYDAEVDLHYTMVDGSKCKQLAVPCKKAGSTITNTQCGGAKKVEVYLGSGYTGKEKECKIGLHNIGFECNAPQKYNEPAPPTAGAYNIASSPPLYTPPASSSKAQSSAAVSTPVSAYCNEGYGQGCTSAETSSAKTSTAVTTPVQTPSSSLSHSSSFMSHFKNSSSKAPHHRTIPSSSHKTSSTLRSSSSCSSQPPIQSYPPIKVADVLPTCMNTWLQITTTDCKDNTAADCYCKNSKFTKSVIDCVQAWSKTDEETKNNLRYLVGICAKYVPENPSLIEDCPKGTFNSPIIPTGGNSTSTKASLNTPAPSGTPTPDNPVAIIVYGNVSLAVPAIHFSIAVPTPGATPAAQVGIVYGAAPPMAPATPTPTPTFSLLSYPVTSAAVNGSMATGTGVMRPLGTVSSRPTNAMFTGAAAALGIEGGVVVFGAAVAFFAL